MNKKEKEQQIVELMINLYCRKKHKNKNLCRECQDLLDYANLKISKCPFTDTKTFCSNCSVHCYQENYRIKIRRIMKYCGPLMIFFHPIIAIKHLLSTIKERK